MNRFHQYIEDVVSGKQIAGKLIKYAIKRHLLDLKKSKTDWPYYFDEKTASEVIKFAEICRHWKGEKSGQRIVLEPHQCFYFGSLFGWKRKDNHTRRFNRSYKQVSRKNGKTTELALMSLYHLLFDGEDGAQVYCGATKEEQARILVNDAGRIAQRTPELIKRFKHFVLKDIVRHIVLMKSHSFITAIGRDSKTQDGYDPSMGMIDEFHEHPNQNLYNVIVSGMGSRRQPLINIITTAGFNKEFPCYAVVRKTCIDILKGIKQDENYFIMIFELDEEDDWKDSNNWIKSNPNLGVSVKESYLKANLNTAINEGSTTEVNFKTKHLNIWTDSSDTWINDELWEACNKPFDISQLEGQRCYGGLDLAKSIDLNAFVLIFPDFDPIPILCFFWMPEDMVSKNRVSNYKKWVFDGLIKTTHGNIVDNRFITNFIINLAKKYNIESIAFDRFLAQHGVVQELVDEGVTMHELGQGYVSLSTPTKELEKLVYSEGVNPLGNPVLRWMMSNVVIDTDPAGNIKPNKGKSGNKIDGVAALVNAIAEWMTFENESITEIRFV